MIHIIVFKITHKVVLIPRLKIVYHKFLSKDVYVNVVARKYRIRKSVPQTVVTFLHMNITNVGNL